MNRFKTSLLVLAVTACACLLLGMIFKMGLPLFSLGVVAVPVGVLLINRQKWLFQITLASFFSSLTIPGMPGGLNVFHLLAGFYIVVSVLGYCLRKELRQPWNLCLVLAMMFAINLGIIILVRGSGFRFMGDTNWGGLRYVDLYISLLFVLLARHTRLTEKEWNVTMWMVLGCSLIPFVAEMLLLVSGGRIYQQYMFIRSNANTMLSLMAEQEGSELVRFQSANRLGVYALLLGLYFLCGERRRKWVGGAFVTTGIALVGLSGHRSGFLDLLLVPWLAGFLWPGIRKATYIWVSIFAFALFMVPLYVFAKYLPVVFQRGVSILPGIQVSPVAQMDAKVTIEWRLDLWREALREVERNPSYLLVGKGLTYSGAEFEALGAGEYSEHYYWWAVITSTYHQGLISLLVCTGIPGMFLGLSFLGVGVFRHLASHFTQWHRPGLRTIHYVLLVYFIVLVAKYMFVSGDLYLSWPLLCIWLVMLENIRQTDALSPAGDDFGGGRSVDSSGIQFPTKSRACPRSDLGPSVYRMRY